MAEKIAGGLNIRRTSMRVFRSARWLLLALLLPFISTSQAHAGVYISVGFAPPILPVYVQPPCPEPNLMWAPGYWAYGDDGYYWVPGAWVPAPYEGALWTPPYWGWQEGTYMFHPGYWGYHVGYYGGVNYGFGYMGIGFIGGRWHEHGFEYNTAVVHVNETIIHTTYIDRTVIHDHEVVHDSHVAYAGGPGGINHQPSADERVAMHEQHVAPTQFQEQHMQSARTDHASYFNTNHGRPQNVALARPLAAEHHEPPAAGARAGQAGVNGNAGNRGEFRNGQAAQPVQPQRPAQTMRPQDNQRPTYQPQPRPAPESRPTYQPPPQPRQESRPAPQPRYQAPPQPRQESRPAPEPRYQAPPQPRQESRPAPEARPAPPPPRQESRPAPEARPAAPPRQESRPAPEPKHDAKPPKEPKR
jgi:hypothetical protein